MSEAEVEYDLTEADVMRLLEHHHRTSPTSRRLRHLVEALGGGAGWFIAFLLGRGWESMVWACVGVATVLALYRWPGPVFNRAVWKRTLREGSGRLFGLRTLSLRPEGVFSASDHFESTIRWSAIDRVESDSNYLFLMMTAGGIPIPRHAFSSSDASDAFLRRAKEWHHASRVRADA